MLRLSFERSLRKGTFRHNAIVAVHMPCIFCPTVSNLNRGQDTRANGPDTQRAQAHNHTQNSNPRTHPRQTSRSHAHTTHTHTLHFLFTGHSQSAVISRSHPALTPPPSLRPAPPLPVKHKYRVLAPGGYFYSIIASDRSFSPTPSRVVHVAFCPVLLGRDCVR